MITIKVKRTNAGSSIIREVVISGHALYDDYGKDIVCAAVSAVSINLINAVEALVGIPLKTEQGDGLLVCYVPELQDAQVNERVQLLMETLVYSLESIAKAYPSFVTISEQHEDEMQYDE